MKKLIITFAVFAVVFLFARLLFGYYVDVVPVFEVLLTSFDTQGRRSFSGTLCQILRGHTPTNPKSYILLALDYIQHNCYNLFSFLFTCLFRFALAFWLLCRLSALRRFRLVLAVFYGFRYQSERQGNDPKHAVKQIVNSEYYSLAD